MIVTLTDLSQVYLNFTATEKDASILAVGQTVDAVVDAYPGRKFQGKITTIEPQISTDTRNIRVQATIENPEGLLKQIRRPRPEGDPAEPPTEGDPRSAPPPPPRRS